MGEAKRRKELGLQPKNQYGMKNRTSNTTKLNDILNKYPYMPYIIGFSLLFILIIDLVNYYN